MKKVILVALAVCVCAGAVVGYRAHDRISCKVLAREFRPERDIVTGEQQWRAELAICSPGFPVSLSYVRKVHGEENRQTARMRFMDELPPVGGTITVSRRQTGLTAWQLRRYAK